MCGRIVLATTADALARDFAALDGGLPLEPRWNIGPTQCVVVLRVDEGQRLLSVLRWGLVPSWTAGPSAGPSLINARSETVAEKPTFRDALRKRRCIVPASGFYEWKRGGGRAQPWYFSAPSGATLAIAGLWERWQDPDGASLETCCLLTTTARGAIAPVHHRMPVLLDHADLDRWLDPHLNDSAAVSHLLRPAPDDALRGHPVNPAVGAVAHDQPDNIDPWEPKQGSFGF